LIVTCHDLSYILSRMSPRKLQMQTIYLEPDKAGLLDELSDSTRIPKAVLLREAVDDLLVKFKKLKASKRRP
jgi:hypothetical protein